MEPQVELLNLIVDTVQNGLELSISLDGLPADGGICAELAAGYNDGLYYDKSAVRILPVLFLSKNKDQQFCVNNLSRICNYFQLLKKYPAAESFSWLDAVTATEPNKTGRQEDGQYIYSAIINMKIYF
jgi:hypothetical protein